MFDSGSIPDIKNLQSMNLKTISYLQYEKNLPQSGKHIIGQLSGSNIVVYQAFNPKISEWAIANQKFGGPFYSYSRMSWIKPNFLWMMYRSGWAMKEHQQNILAIKIPVERFEILLNEAVHSNYIEEIYKTHENWKQKLNRSLVRLQWDPDHNPGGAKLERRAIQIGIRGKMLEQFGTDWIVSIEDITDFVKLQKQRFDAGNMEDFQVIEEQVIKISNTEIARKLHLDDF
jgi:hypothetical protein